ISTPLTSIPPSMPVPTILIICRMLLLLVMGLAWSFHGASCLPHPTGLTWAEEGAEGQCQCVPQLCPRATTSSAGLVCDHCGCCLECGNAEGQLCYLDGSGTFYGRCGENLECQLDIQEIGYGGIPEPQCVCRSQAAVCGSDHITYQNICKFQEAVREREGRNLSITSNRPCLAVPQIKHHTQDQVNVSGHDVIFMCEVFAYPMALVEWRKDEEEFALPGGDPHISIQFRGGPLRYELSNWLQIEGVRKADGGTYFCIAHNKLGNATAKATLLVATAPPALFSSPANPGEEAPIASKEEEDYSDYY
uniref:Ig-like domain-containing protein n=1 Tax=Gopherus agassizii TaxID=38772 RepID=A0A452IWI1_9SAUR